MNQNRILIALCAALMGFSLQACADQQLAQFDCTDACDKVCKVKVDKENDGRPSVDYSDVTVCSGQTVEWKSEKSEFDLDFDRAPEVGESGAKKYKSKNKKVEIVVSQPFVEGGDNAYKYSVVIGDQMLDPRVIIGR